MSAHGSPSFDRYIGIDYSSAKLSPLLVAKMLYG